MAGKEIAPHGELEDSFDGLRPKGIKAWTGEFHRERKAVEVGTMSDVHHHARTVSQDGRETSAVSSELYVQCVLIIHISTHDR